MAITGNVLPTYLGSGDPGRRFTDYPAWLDKLADDVTVERSLMDVAAQRPEAVNTSRRSIGHAARCCYCLAWWARSSPALPMASTSLPASPETGLLANFRR
jgi:hypothetical protein